MSDNLGITQYQTNQNSPETPVNTANGELDAALTESFAVDFTAGNVVLSTLEWQRNINFEATNLSVVGRTLTVPQVKHLAIIDNTAGTEDLGVIRGSTTVTVPTLEIRLLYADGTINGLEAVGGGGGVSTFLDLIDTPATFTGQGLKGVAVNVGETALEFVDLAADATVSLSTRHKGARVERTTNEATADGVAEIINWQQASFDTGVGGTSFAEFATNPSRITIPAGVTKVKLRANILDDQDVVLEGRFLKNGSAAFDGNSEVIQEQTAQATLGNAISLASGVLDVVATDFFEVQVEATGQISNVLADGGNRTWFEVEVFEEIGSGTQPTGFIAVNPEFRGVRARRTTNQSIPTGTITNIIWESTDTDTGFQPDDGGPPQKFWLGPDLTFTAAVNDEVTATAHALQTGDGPFQLLNSGGGLPAPLLVATNYWAVLISANIIKLATSRANALVGTVIDITTTGTGTHTLERAAYLVIPEGVTAVRLNMSIRWSASSVGARQSWIESSGSTKRNAHIAKLGSSNADVNTIASDTVFITSAERLFLSVFQTTAGALNITPLASEQIYISMEVIETSKPFAFPGVTVDRPTIGARVELTTDEALADGVAEVIAWDQASFDTGIHGNAFAEFVTNPSRITIPVGAAKVRIRANLQVDQDVTLEGRFLKNTSAVFDGNAEIITNQTAQATLGTSGAIVSGILEVAATDFFEVQIEVTGQAANLVADGGSRTWFEVEVIETTDSAFVPEQIDATAIAKNAALVASVVEYKKVAIRRFSLFDEFAGSAAHAGTAPTVTSQVFDVKRNGTVIGTVTFAIAATTATFVTTAAIQEDFEVSDVLTIETQGSVNAVIRDVGINLFAFRS